MRIIAFALLVSLLTGCANIGTLSPDSTINFENESVFLLGVDPAEFNVVLSQGSVIQGDVFVPNYDRPSVLAATPVDGFILGKAKAKTALAITEVRKNVGILGAEYGREWMPCDLMKTPGLIVPAGKVIYMLSARYTASGERGGRLATEYSLEMEKAKAFLWNHYPSLVDKLVLADLQSFYVWQACP